MTSVARPRPPRRRDKTHAWTAAKILIFAGFVALGVALFISWQPVVNPNVQDCGSPIGFFAHDRDNVTIHPGTPEAPPNAVALASQPTCRDLAYLQLEKAALAGFAFLALTAAGVIVGLLDDRIAYWRAPRFESLLRDMPRESRIRHGLVPNVDVDELGRDLPPLESPEIAGLVVFGLATFVVLPFVGPLEATRDAAAGVGAGAVLLGLILMLVVVAAASAQRAAVYPSGQSWSTTLQVVVATSWVGRLRPLVGTFGIDIHHLRRGGSTRESAVVDVKVLQTVSALSHAALLVVTTLAVLGATRSAPTFERPQLVLAGFLVVMVLSGLSRFTKRWRGLPVRPGVAGLKGLTQVASSPVQVVELIGGTVVISVAEAGALAVSLGAVGVTLPFVQVLFVSLVGTTIAALGPTPHGVGVFEAVVVLVLFGLGVDPGAAVCATLVFRLVTFWMPMIPAWWVARRLRSTGAL